MLEATRGANDFQRGSKQEVPESRGHSVTFRRSTFIFCLSWYDGTLGRCLCKGKSATGLQDTEEGGGC